MGDTLEPLHAGLTRTAPTPASQAEDAARTSVPADRPVLGPVPPKEIVPPVSTQQDIKTSTQMFISDARIIIKKLNECIARGDKAGAFAIVNDEVEIVKGKKNSAILFQAGYKTLDSIKESITSGRPVSLRMNLIDNAVTIVQEGKYYLEGAGVDLVAASRYLEQYNENKEQTTTAFILGGSSYSHKQEAQAEARKSFRDMWTDKKDGSLSQPAARDLFKYFIDVSTLFDSDTIDLFFNLPLDENAAIDSLVAMGAKRLGGVTLSESMAGRIREAARSVYGTIMQMKYEAARQGLGKIKEIDIDSFPAVLKEIQQLTQRYWEAKLEATQDTEVKALAPRMKNITDEAEKLVSRLQAYGTSDEQKAGAIAEIEANNGLLEAAGYDVESLKFSVRKGKIVGMDSQKAVSIMLSDDAERLFPSSAAASRDMSIFPHDFFAYGEIGDPVVEREIENTRARLLATIPDSRKAEAEFALDMVRKGYWGLVIDVSETKDPNGDRTKLTIVVYLSKGNKQLELINSSEYTLKGGNETISGQGEFNPFLYFVQRLINEIEPTFPVSAATGKIDHYTYDALRNLKSNPRYAAFFPKATGLQTRYPLKPDDLAGEQLGHVSEGVKSQTPLDIQEQVEATRLAQMIATGTVFEGDSSALTGGDRKKILEVAMALMNRTPVNLTRSTHTLTQPEKIEWRKKIGALRDKLLDEKGYDAGTEEGRRLQKIQRKLIFFCVIAKGVAEGRIIAQDAVAEVESYLKQAKTNEERTRITDESDPSRILEDQQFKSPAEVRSLAALGVEFMRFLSPGELDLFRKYDSQVSDPLNLAMESMFRRAGLKDGDINELKTLDIDQEYSRQLNEMASVVGKIAGSGLSIAELVLAERLAVIVPEGVSLANQRKVVAEAIGMAYAGIDVKEERKGRYVEARTAAAELAERYTSLRRKQQDDFVMGKEFSNRLVDRIVIDGEALRVLEKMAFFRNSSVAMQMAKGPAGQGVQLHPGALPDPTRDGYRADVQTEKVEQYPRTLSAIVAALANTGYPISGLPGVTKTGETPYGRAQIAPPAEEMCSAHILAAIRVFGGSNYLINGALADDEEINLVRRFTESDFSSILCDGASLSADERSLLSKIKQWSLGFQVLLSEQEVVALSSLMSSSRVNDLGKMVLSRVYGFKKAFKQGLDAGEIDTLNRFAAVLEQKGSYILSLEPEDRVDALFADNPGLYRNALLILKKISYGLSTSLVMRDLVKKRDASQGFAATALHAIVSGNREASIQSSDLIQQIGAQSWLIALLKMHYFNGETVGKLTQLQTQIDSLRTRVKQLEARIIEIIKNAVKNGTIKPKNDEEIKRLMAYLLYDTKDPIFLNEGFSALKKQIEGLKSELIVAKKQIVADEIESNRIYTYLFDGSIDRQLWDRIKTLPGINNYKSYARQLFGLDDRTRLADIDGHVIFDDLVQVVEEGMLLSGSGGDQRFNSYEVCVGEKYEVTKAKLALQIILNGLDQGWKEFSTLRAIAAAPAAVSSGGVWLVLQYVVGGIVTGAKPGSGRTEEGPSSSDQVVKSLTGSQGTLGLARSSFLQWMSRSEGYSQPVGMYMKQLVGYSNPARYFIEQLRASGEDYFKAQNSVSGDDILTFIDLAESALAQVERYSLQGRAWELTKSTNPEIRYTGWRKFFDQLRLYAQGLKAKGERIELFNPEYYEDKGIKVSGKTYDSRYLLSVMLLDYMAIRGTLPQPPQSIEMFDCPYQSFDPQTFVKANASNNFEVTHYVKGNQTIAGAAAFGRKVLNDVEDLFHRGFMKDGLQLSDLGDIGISLGKGYLRTIVEWYYLIPLDIAKKFAQFSAKAVNCLMNGDTDGFKKFSIEALKTVWFFLRWESGIELFRMFKDVARDSEDPAQAFAKLFAMLPILIGSAHISRATFGVGLTSVLDIIKVSARAASVGVELFKNGRLNRAGLRNLPEGTLRYIFEPITESFRQSYLGQKLAGRTPDGRPSMIGSRVVDVIDLTFGNIYRGVRRAFSGSAREGVTVADIFGSEIGAGDMLIEGGLADLGAMQRLRLKLADVARRVFHEPPGTPRALGIDSLLDGIDNLIRDGISRTTGGRILRPGHVTLDEGQVKPPDMLRQVVRGRRTQTFDFTVSMENPWAAPSRGTDMVVADPAAVNPLEGQYVEGRAYKITFSNGKSVVINGEFLNQLMLAEETPEAIAQIRTNIRTGQRGGALPSVEQLTLIRQRYTALGDANFSLTEYGVVSLFNVRNAGGFVHGGQTYQLDLAVRRAADLVGDNFMSLDEARAILHDSVPGMNWELLDHINELPDFARNEFVNQFSGVFDRMRTFISEHTEPKMMQRFVMFECKRLEALAKAQRPAVSVPAADVAAPGRVVEMPVLGLPEHAVVVTAIPSTEPYIPNIPIYEPFEEELPLAASDDLPPEEGGARSGHLSRAQADKLGEKSTALDAQRSAEIQKSLETFGEEGWISPEVRAKAGAAGDGGIRFKSVPDGEWPASLDGGMAWVADGKGGYDVYIKEATLGSADFESDLLHEMVEIHLRERGNAEGIHDVAEDAGQLFDRAAQRVDGSPSVEPTDGAATEEALKVEDIEAIDVPAGEAKPPAGEVKPPAGEVKPPAGEAKPPAGEAKPPAGEVKPPAGEAKPPAGEVKPPAGEVKPPAGEAKPPAGEAKPPAEAPVVAAGTGAVAAATGAAIATQEETRLPEMELPRAPEAPTIRVKLIGELNTWGHIGRDLVLLELINVLAEGKLPTLNREFWVRQGKNLAVVAGLNYAPRVAAALADTTVFKALMPGLAAKLGGDPAVMARWSKGVGLGMSIAFSAMQGFSNGVDPGQNIGDFLRKYTATELYAFVLGGGGELLTAAIGGTLGVEAAGAIAMSGGICAVVAGVAFIGGEIYGTIHYYHVSKDGIKYLNVMESERMNGIGMRAAASGWIAPELRAGLTEGQLQTTLMLQASSVLMNRFTGVANPHAGPKLEDVVTWMWNKDLKNGFFGGFQTKILRLRELANPRDDKEKAEKATLESEIREKIIQILKEHPEQISNILSAAVIQQTQKVMATQSRMQSMSYGCFDRMYEYYNPGFWTSGLGSDTKVASYGFMAQANTLFAYQASWGPERQRLKGEVEKVFGRGAQQINAAQFRRNVDGSAVDEDIVAFLDANIPNWRWLLVPRAHGGDRETFIKMLGSIAAQPFIKRYMNRIDRKDVFPVNLAEIYMRDPSITVSPRDFWKTYKINPSMSWQQMVNVSGDTGALINGTGQYFEQFMIDNLSQEDYAKYGRANAYGRMEYVKKAKEAYASKSSKEIARIKESFYGTEGFFGQLKTMSLSFYNRGLEIRADGKVAVNRTISKTALRKRLGSITEEDFSKLLKHLFLNPDEEYLMPNVNLIGELNGKLTGLKGYGVISEAQGEVLATVMRDLLLQKSVMTLAELNESNPQLAQYVFGSLQYILSLYQARGHNIVISNDFDANLRQLNAITQDTTINNDYIDALIKNTGAEVNGRLSQLEKSQ